MYKLHESSVINVTLVKLSVSSILRKIGSKSYIVT